MSPRGSLRSPFATRGPSAAEANRDVRRRLRASAGTSTRRRIVLRRLTGSTSRIPRVSCFRRPADDYQDRELGLFSSLSRSWSARVTRQKHTREAEATGQFRLHLAHANISTALRAGARTRQPVVPVRRFGAGRDHLEAERARNVRRNCHRRKANVSIG